MNDVLIIGGGAAGMMSAIMATEEGKRVTIIEKNEKLGKKLYITGKGRCNLTNNAEIQDILKNIISNPMFMMSALYSFSPQELMSYFEGHGLKLKTERGNRVFPMSDKSADVLDAFKKRLRALNVVVKLNEAVTNCVVEDESIVSVETTKGIYHPSSVIIATGGLSYPATGSTGDGYKIAQSLGHTLIKPCAALCPIILSGAFNAQNKFVSRNILPFPQGLSLKNVTLRCGVVGKKKAVYDEMGEMLFMDNGISGPLVLSASSKINRLDVGQLYLSIDLKPALTLDMLDQRIQRDFKQANTKQFKNALGELLPKTLISYIIYLSNIDENKPVNVITKEERLALAKIIKSLSFKVESLGTIKESIITAGGISTKEIAPASMQSKKVSNLYFAGEVIDVDALTGGFNLQVAFSTAYLAGKNA